MEFAAYQLVAYVSLTIASITVAITSVVIGWWQIFGWRPTVFVTGIGVSRFEAADIYQAIITFEVWNRRKYPIAINGGSSIIFGKTVVVDGPENSGWQKWRNTMCYYGDKIRIEPLSHVQIIVDARLKAENRDAIADSWLVEIKYFDPTANKELTMSAVAHYLQPEHGKTPS